MNEGLPSLSDIALETGGGAWPAGWYRARILPGYSTSGGKQVETGDMFSKAGDSRNLKIAMSLRSTTDRADKEGNFVKANSERNMNTNMNYRPDDLTAARIEQVKQAREHFKGVQGRWADADIQATSLSLGRLGQFEKAIGFRLTQTPAGGFATAPLIGQEVDVRIKIDEKSGYNEVTAFAKAGERVKQ